MLFISSLYDVCSSYRQLSDAIVACPSTDRMSFSSTVIDLCRTHRISVCMSCSRSSAYLNVTWNLISGCTSFMKVWLSVFSSPTTLGCMSSLTKICSNSVYTSFLVGMPFLSLNLHLLSNLGIVILSDCMPSVPLLWCKMITHSYPVLLSGRMYLEVPARVKFSP